MTSEGHIDSGTDLHSFIKCVIQQWASRNDYLAEKEAKGEFSNEKVRPDVVLRYKGRQNMKSIVYIEVQKECTDTWTRKKMSQYKTRELLILEEDDYDIPTRDLTFAHWLSVVQRMIETDLQDFCLAPPPPKKKTSKKRRMEPTDADDMIKCERCNKPRKRKNLKNSTLGKICNSCLKKLWRKEHGREV